MQHIEPTKTPNKPTTSILDKSFDDLGPQELAVLKAVLVRGSYLNMMR